MPDYVDYNMGYAPAYVPPPPQNRVQEALRYREKVDALAAARNPLLVKTPAYIKQKIEYLKYIDKKFGKSATKAEKVSLSYLQSQKRFLQSQWNPKPIHKVLFHPIARFLRNWFTGNALAHRQQDNEFKAVHLDFAQRRSYDNISKAIAKQGLQTNVEADLKQMIELNLPAFSIPCKDDRNDRADFILHCEKIPNTDIYYIQKIDVASRPTDEELNRGNARIVTYTINPAEKQSLSAVQAANLVNGKMVCLEGNSWMRLDPNRIQQEDAFQVVKFDLARALRDLPLADTSAKALQELESGLKSGKRWDASLTINGQPEKCMLTVLSGERRLLVQDRSGTELQLPKPAVQLNEQQAQRAQQVMNQGLQQEAGRVVEMGRGRVVHR